MKPATANILPFLRDLKENNHREWFESNRKNYELARKTLESFVEAVIHEIQAFDPSVGVLKAKDCIFRIHKDTRFSKDKTPYKTNMGAFIALGGRKSRYAGYYIHLEPDGKSFAGGGLYMPETDFLKAVRQEIFYNVKEFKAILEAKDFRKVFGQLDKMGDELKKAPQGFPADWPDIELLKFKNYVVGRYMSDDTVESGKAIGETTEAFRAMQPLVAFINRAVEIPKG